MDLNCMLLENCGHTIEFAERCSCIRLKNGIESLDRTSYNVVEISGALMECSGDINKSLAEN